MKKSFLSFLALIFLGTLPAQAAIQTQVVEYKQGETVLEGYLAYDDAVTAPHPGVLVVHEWKGLDGYAKKRAEQIAGLGYVAFAADIYGKGVRPQDYKEAGQQAGIYKGNRLLTRQRALAGLEVLRSNPRVDPAQLAAIGYCFGGMVALELGRSGADLKGIVSFHGALETPNPEDAKNIKAKVLVLHGAEDPFVSAKEVAGFEEEMRSGLVDWQLVKYSGAVHAFTNPESGSDSSKGAAYNEKADKRSWIAMKDFFSEIFS